MKILSPCKSGVIDPCVMKFLNYLQMSDLDVTIVPVTRTDNYVFNPALHEVSGPWVLVDFCENGWRWNRKETHIWGKNTMAFSDVFEKDLDEWITFGEFVYLKPPVITFCRELLQKDVTDKLRPIEYPAYEKVWEPESKEDFLARPINTFFSWGHSHEARVRLHAAFFTRQGELGGEVIDNIFNLDPYFKDPNTKKENLVVSAYMPHYARVDISHIYAISGISKITVSLAGAGFKCFRSSEAPINSIMLMHEDDLSYSFPWIDGSNCFKAPYYGPDVKESPEFERIKELQGIKNHANLYSVYLSGLENAKKYEVEAYSQYILNQIREGL